MEAGKCGICHVVLTKDNINQKTKADLCVECFNIQIMIFKGGSKELPYIKPSQITKYLWLGEEASSTKLSQLQKEGIKNILIVGAAIEQHFPKDIKYMQIHVDDHPSTDLHSHFLSIYEFIHSAESKEEGVLVHCVSGMSRSATAVISYLMKKESWTYTAAYELSLIHI
eukprot:TRINITY_DN7487_c0_g1_i1.p1 TRINITY_DN7487_c0_g1~~TRINITY_DN7487_c0_g1_i1.p1  ORF type:complete len:169 (+),score=34.86 TRINITY_DN7487_c0_g1_i1:40-546(+)